MRIFAVIAGLLVASFGGGCLFLVDKWASGLVVVLGWLPLLAGFGLAGYAGFRQWGTPFPMPVKVIVWLIILAFIAAFGSLFISVVYFDFRLAG